MEGSLSTLRGAGRRRCVFWMLGLALGLALLGGAGSTAFAGTQVYPCDNERLGYGVVSGIEHYDVVPLRAGWYVDWGAKLHALHPGAMDFAQVVRVTRQGYYVTDGQELAAIVAQNRGSLWLIGNEPDAPAQDNVSPEDYARVYHQAYYDIKRVDPAAQVAIGGIVQATPLRMKWLDRVWAEYQRTYGETMPVDVWNVHAFVLREARPGYGSECNPNDTGTWGAGIPAGLPDNCGLWVTTNQIDDHNLFVEQIVRFRTWMRDHGQQNKELVVSEYGILFNEELGYTPARVRDYMRWTFDYFMTARDPQLGYPADDYHLVQRWAWFSLDVNSFGWGTTHSALMTAYNPQRPDIVPQLTDLGRDFRDYAQAKQVGCPAYVDLQPIRFQVTGPAAITYGEPVQLNLALEVRNQGNVASAPAQVRFWDGDPGAGGTVIGTAALAAVPARYQGAVTVSLDKILPAWGKHSLIAEVDFADQVAETREDNNRLATTVNFGTANLAVGAARWQLDRGPLRPGEAAQITLLPVTATLTQTEAADPGLNVIPPAWIAAWYDGDPAAGGQLIASTAMPAPAAFGGALTVPAQAWAPVMAGPRTAWLVVSLANGAQETSLADNRARTDIAADTDLVLKRAELADEASVITATHAITVQIRFLAANNGALAPGVPIQVGVWAGTAPKGLEIGRVQLAPAGDWTEYVTWKDLGEGANPYIAVIDPNNQVPESREDNNALSGSVIVAPKRLFLPVIRR